MMAIWKYILTIIMYHLLQSLFKLDVIYISVYLTGLIMHQFLHSIARSYELCLHRKPVPNLLETYFKRNLFGKGGLQMHDGHSVPGNCRWARWRLSGALWMLNFVIINFGSMCKGSISVKDFSMFESIEVLGIYFLWVIYWL